MGLRVAEICNNPNEVKIFREFESMGDNLILLKLIIFPQNPSPFHWYLENGRKPPFDVAVNPKNGSLNYLKFFFQDEMFERRSVSFASNLKQQEGIPCFDINQFNEKKYQIFEQGELEPYFDGESLYLTISGVEVQSCLNLNSDNAILLDQEKQIIGVLFRSLSQEEIRALTRAKILKM